MSYKAAATKDAQQWSAYMNSPLELIQLGAAEEQRAREILRQSAILQKLDLVHSEEHHHFYLVELGLLLSLKG